MAYGQKYTSGNITRGGQTYTLVIYQRDYNGSSYEMGDIQGLTVEAQAGDSIDAPICKTSLSFTLADSRDKGTVGGVKYGAWEEFYTPDATKYKVVLSRNGSAMWSGFITPDSWQDNLVYRGSVTIVARDMVGHMQDFDFNEQDIVTHRGSSAVANGMVSIGDLVRTAWAVAGCPANLDFTVGETVPHLTVGQYAPSEWMLDLTAFKGMDWYEAIEKVLASVGLCLRYVDANTFCVLPIRALHLGGYTDKQRQPYRVANFVNRSGSRILDPAYKQIQETLKYDAVEAEEQKWGLVADMDDWGADGFTQYAPPYPQTYYQPASIVNGGGWAQNDNTKEVLRPTTKALIRYDDMYGEEDKCVTIASVPRGTTSSDSRFNYVSTGNFAYFRKKFAPGAAINITFSLAHAFNDFCSARTMRRLPSGTFYYAILWRRASNNTYYTLQDGVWEQGTTQNSQVIEEDTEYSYGNYTGLSANDEMSFSFEFNAPEWPGYLEFRVYPFIHGVKDSGSLSQVGYHIRLSQVIIGFETESVPNYFKIKTVYDSTQNYTLKRDVDFGVVPEKFTTAGAVRNGLYLPDSNYSSIMMASWSNEQGELPLPVLNHLQILSLHSQPSNILSGTLRDKDGDPFRFDACWGYEGRDFILQHGVFDIFANMVADAQLREYLEYEDAIGQFSANYTADLSGGDIRLAQMQNSINAAAGAASGATPGPAPTPSGGTVTSVGLSASSDFSVTGTPVTSSGVLTLTLKADRKILNTTEYRSLIGALAYVNATSVSHWNSAYDSVKNGVVTSLAGLTGSISQAQLQALVGDADSTCLAAPLLKIVESPTDGKVHLRIRHDLLLGVTGAEAVLMVKSARNARLSHRGSNHYHHLKGGWCVAKSRTASRTCSTSIRSIELNTIKQYITRYYTKADGKTPDQMEVMTYSSWCSLSADRGFGSPIQGKTHRHHKKFGIAVRIPNPDFARYATGTVSEHTQELLVTEGSTTIAVPRYIYTDVAPLIANIEREGTGGDWHLGIGIL